MKKNRDRDLDPQPPIYALFSDLNSFEILSYDGTKFQYLTQILVPLEYRTEFIHGMAQGMFAFLPVLILYLCSTVSDLLFSLLLNGYIGVLSAVEKRSRKRGSEGEVSPFVIVCSSPCNHFVTPKVSTHHSFSPGKPLIDKSKAVCIPLPHF